jgi:hypothetical protein
MQKLDKVWEEIQNLSAEERMILREWLDWPTIEESPELLEAIDEGIRSAENEPTFTLEEVWKRMQDRFGFGPWPKGNEKFEISERVEAKDQERLDVLLDKSDANELSQDERSEAMLLVEQIHRISLHNMRVLRERKRA